MNTLSDYVNRLLRPSKILLVEDDESVCMVIKELSRKFNCELTIVGDKASALLALQDGPFDLALLDYRLPDGNCVPIFELIRRQSANLPVCVVTGNLDEEVIERIKEIGFAVFVQKPKDLTPKNLINLFLTFGIKLAPTNEAG